MYHSPILSSDAAVELSDKYLNKAIDAWLNNLSSKAENSVNRLTNFVGSPLGGFPANEKAQIKWIGRAKKVCGNELIGVQFKPCKRRRMAVSFDWLFPVKNVNNLDAEETPWLSFARLLLFRKNPADEIQTYFFPVGTLTRHALLRLIQRASVHSEADIQAICKAIWKSITLVEHATQEDRKYKRGDSWIIPAFLPTQERPVFIVMSGPSKADKDDLFICKTILSDEMVSDEHSKPLLALYEFIKNNDPHKTEEGTAQLIKLVAACRNL